MSDTNEFNFLASQKEFFGVLKGGFLARSIGSLNPHKPLCITKDKTIADALQVFQANKIGSILITEPDGTLAGIFTERDYLLKCAGNESQILTTCIADIMTANPIAQPPDTSIAFVISLMVHGGFRHIPVIDDANKPIGIISVKDIMAAIGQQFLDDIDNI